MTMDDRCSSCEDLCLDIIGVGTQVIHSGVMCDMDIEGGAKYV